MAETLDRAQRVKRLAQTHHVEAPEQSARLPQHDSLLPHLAFRPGRAQADISQFLVDLNKPGITIRPVLSLTGEHHFNEVVLEDVLLPAGAIIGREGDGWRQMTSEPAYEHGGPERFQSSLTLLVELPQVLAPFAANRATIAIVRLDARLVALRRLSHSGAGMLQFGDDPALVEDVGALFEKKIPDIACS